MKIVFKTILWTLTALIVSFQLNIRSEVYLSALETSSCIQKLYKDHSVHEIKQTCNNLAQQFSNDIESSKVLEAEYLNFRRLILTRINLLRNCDILPTCLMSTFMYDETLEEVFPNFEILLRIYLCTAVANFTCVHLQF